MLSRTVAAHLGEGVIARELGALQARYEDLEIGSYPFVRQNRFGASFVIRGTDAARIAACAQELEAIIRSLGCRADRRIAATAACGSGIRRCG